MPAKEDGSLGCRRLSDRARSGTAHVGNPRLESAADGPPEQVLGLGRDRSLEERRELPASEQVDAVTPEAVGSDAAVDGLLHLVEDEGGRHSDTDSECEERVNRRHCDLECGVLRLHTRSSE